MNHVKTLINPLIAFIAGVLLCAALFNQCGNSGGGKSPVVEPTRLERIDNHTADAAQSAGRAEGQIDNATGHINAGAGRITEGQGEVDNISIGASEHQKLVIESSDRIERIALRNNRIAEIIREARQRGLPVEDSDIHQ